MGSTLFLRSVPSLMRVTLWVIVCIGFVALSARLASADPSADDMQKLSDWFARAREKAQESVNQLPPEWKKWLPSNNLSIPTGHALTAADLDRVEIGYQAGILKIVSADGRVLFTKDRPGSVMHAIDSTEYAPLNDGQRRRILSALGIADGELDSVANGLMHEYGRLPTTKAAAVLGVLGSTPAGNGPHISYEVSHRIRSFLTARLRRDTDVKVHRIAILSLALCSEVDEPTVDGVLNLMERSHNSWETFTTQQFFEYHRDEIRSLPNAERVRRRLQSCNNPYGPAIAANL